VILCDTGVLICLVDRSQPQHFAYINAIALLEKPLITNWACLAETMYLAQKQGGWNMQKQVSKFLLSNLLTIYDIQSGNYDRLFELMAKYQDRPMDLADATLVLTAEKMGTNQILTLDRDFLFYRIADRASAPQGGRDSFNIIQV
jgi:uncharacterized protein